MAGLAREAEAVRRRLDQLDRKTERVDELAELVSRLAENAASPMRRRTWSAVSSWLDFPTGVPPPKQARASRPPSSC